MKRQIEKRIEEICFSLFDPFSKKRCQHFSFIILKNKIIAIGQNNKKTHPINLKNKKLSHSTGEDVSNLKYTCSEFNAILKLKRLTNIDSSKCNLINIRINRNQKIDFAKPCSSCLNLLKYFEFKSVEFTDENGKYIKMKPI